MRVSSASSSSNCALSLLRELALELSNSAATLSALAAGVETETESKVQDWLAHARSLEQTGCSKEFVHGNV
jgi:hypothetical protein